MTAIPNAASTTTLRPSVVATTGGEAMAPRSVDTTTAEEDMASTTNSTTTTMAKTALATATHSMPSTASNCDATDRQQEAGAAAPVEDVLCVASTTTVATESLHQRRRSFSEVLLGYLGA